MSPKRGIWQCYLELKPVTLKIKLSAGWGCCGRCLVSIVAAERKAFIPIGNHSPGHHGQRDPRASGVMASLCKNHLGTNDNFFKLSPTVSFKQGLK